MGEFSDKPDAAGRQVTRPKSRAPAAMVSKDVELAGTYSRQRWSHLKQPSPQKLHGLSGAAPRRMPMKGESLESLLGTMHYVPPQSAGAVGLDAGFGPDEPEPAPFAEGTVRVVLYGPPGSGRKTQSEMLLAKFGVVLLASGGIVKARAEVGGGCPALPPRTATTLDCRQTHCFDHHCAPGNPFGLRPGRLLTPKLPQEADDQLSAEIGSCLAAADYLSDEVMEKVLESAITTEVKERGYVMNGFARTKAQAEHVKVMAEVKHVFFLEVRAHPKHTTHPPARRCRRCCCCCC